MEEQDRMTVKEILTGALREKKMTIARLAEATDIPERYVALLVEGKSSESAEGELKGLPPAPYVRGYLMRIAGSLGLDGQVLWQAYTNQLHPKTSGESDTMPTNRFAFKRLNRKKIIMVVIVIAVLAGLGIWVRTLLGTGVIDIKSPSQESTVTNVPSIDLQGRIDPSDRLTINNEDTAIDKSGYFEKQFSLEPGINSVEFKVKRLLGKETVITKQIIYQQ